MKVKKSPSRKDGRRRNQSLIYKNYNTDRKKGKDEKLKIRPVFASNPSGFCSFSRFEISAGEDKGHE